MKWTRSAFLVVAGKSKFLVKHFLMGILSRSWSFQIRTWTRNAKLTRLMIFISSKIWHRRAPRNTSRNAASYRQKVTSVSLPDDVLTRVDWALTGLLCFWTPKSCSFIPAITFSCSIIDSRTALEEPSCRDDIFKDLYACTIHVSTSE